MVRARSNDAPFSPCKGRERGKAFPILCFPFFSFFFRPLKEKNDQERISWSFFPHLVF